MFLQFFLFRLNAVQKGLFFVSIFFLLGLEFYLQAGFILSGLNATWVASLVEETLVPSLQVIF